MEWSDPSVLRAFRATSSRYLRRADVLLSHHLLIAATDADGEGELAAEICPLRPSDDGLYVPHGRHPALRHLFAPTSALSTTAPANGTYGFFHHDPSTVSDLRIAVRQASAVQAVLESTEVVDVAGRLSTQTMRQLRASAVNAQLYRLHLDKENTHLLGEFEQGKRVTLSLHLDSGVAATPVQARAMGAVRRLILNVQMSAEGPFVPPSQAALNASTGGQLEVVIAPSTGLLEGMDPDRALISIRTAYASAIFLAISLCPGSTTTCLGLDADAYALLGISDHEVEYLLRLEISRLESLLVNSLPIDQHDSIRHSLSGVKFTPRQSYVKRIGCAHFALETNPTWFGGNEMTHAADESYNDSFSMVEGNSAVVLGGALEHILQQVHAHRPLGMPSSMPSTVETGTGKRVVSASPSFVIVDTPEGSEHYFPAPRRRLTRPATRHRKRNSLCVLM